MDSTNHEVIYFRYVRNLNGTLEPVDLARRNGRLVPRFHPSILEPASQDEAAESPEYRDLVAEVSQNLNAVEQRTWLRLLDGLSILDIAKEENVTRAAIYDRLRRMVAKNDYVAIWWRLKNKTNQHS